MRRTYWCDHAGMAVHLQTKVLVGGQWTEGGGVPLAVTNPATGERLAEVATVGTDEVDRLVAGAVAGADVMEAMPPFERATLLHAVADLLDERAPELARLLTMEQGKPLKAEAEGEVEESAEIFRWAAEEVKRPVPPARGAAGAASGASTRCWT